MKRRGFGKEFFQKKKKTLHQNQKRNKLQQRYRGSFGRKKHLYNLAKIIELNQRIDASALGYAISFLLMVALLCTGVLLVSSVNKRLEHFYLTKEHLVFDNYVSLQLGAEMKSETKQLIHVSGDTSLIIKKQWGAFEIVTSNTFHKSLHIESSVLIGHETSNDIPTLYIPENNQPLKLAGDALVEGEVFVSERGVDRAYIAGRSYSRNKLIDGKISKSERFLPALGNGISLFEVENLVKNTQIIEQLPKDSTFSFQTKTALYQSFDVVILDGKLKGNLIIRSFEKIIVTEKSNLEHVILIAPEIIFEKNTKAVTQVIALKRIVLESEVRLLYPSVCVLQEEKPEMDGKIHEILIGENAKVLGGILLRSSQPDFRKPLLLKIAEQAVVAGLVYNVGETEIKGSVIGHCYTNALVLRYGGGENSNHLLDCTLSSVKLPKGFVFPNWLKNTQEIKNKIITRL
jgi:hypothetical protein